MDNNEIAKLPHKEFFEEIKKLRYQQQKIKIDLEELMKDLEKNEIYINYITLSQEHNKIDVNIDSIMRKRNYFATKSRTLP